MCCSDPGTANTAACTVWSNMLHFECILVASFHSIPILELLPDTCIRTLPEESAAEVGIILAYDAAPQGL